MSNPLAGTGGKPILGTETPNKHFVGRVVIELFEGQHLESDADGLVLSISPGLGMNLASEELLKRIATALPARIPKLAAAFEQQHKMQQELGGS